MKKYIKPRSTKRSAKEASYSALRKRFLLNHPVCRIRYPGLCTLKATQVHHTMGRIEELLNNQEYWLPVCANCHEWVERHPEAARELGYSKSRLNK